MSNKKIQERKKIEKQKRSKAKVEQRRIVLKKKQKYDKQVSSDAQKSFEKLTPIVNEKTKEKIKQEALKKNMEILKGLEKEYEERNKTRQEVNEHLESQGCTTLAEKIDHMGQMANEQAPPSALIQKSEEELNKILKRQMI